MGGIRHVDAVVARIDDTVAVAIVTRVADAVSVTVGLVRIGNGGAVVAGVRRMVIVGVRVVVVTWADVTGVADAVAVRVGLIGVRPGRAVVGDR